MACDHFVAASLPDAYEDPKQMQSEIRADSEIHRDSRFTMIQYDSQMNSHDSHIGFQALNG